MKPLYLSYLSLAITLLTLSVIFVMTGFSWGVIINGLVGSLWGLAIWRKWRVGNMLSLFFVILGISLAVMAGGSRILALFSTLAALATWDFASFHRKLLGNDEIHEEDEIIRTHLLRLSSVLILGVTLPLAAFTLSIELRFWQVFLLGAILLLGLSQVFAQLKRSSNS